MEASPSSQLVCRKGDNQLRWYHSSTKVFKWWTVDVGIGTNTKITDSKRQGYYQLNQIWLELFLKYPSTFFFFFKCMGFFPKLTFSPSWIYYQASNLISNLAWCNFKKIQCSLIRYLVSRGSWLWQEWTECSKWNKSSFHSLSPSERHTGTKAALASSAL